MTFQLPLSFSLALFALQCQAWRTALLQGMLPFAEAQRDRASRIRASHVFERSTASMNIRLNTVIVMVSNLLAMAFNLLGSSLYAYE